MKQVTAKILTDGANTLAISSGIGTSAWGSLEAWDFINTNAAGLGVACTLFFGLMAFFFNIYNASKATQADKNKKSIEANEEKLDVLEQGIKNILDELKKKP